MTDLVLDAGALIALERGDRSVAILLREARRSADLMLVPAPVWAQVWRAHPRQALLARFRRSEPPPQIVPLDDAAADRVGLLLAQSGTRDVVDAHVVVVARAAGASLVLTSDPGDIRRLDPALRLVRV